ncbi:MAG: 3-ketoacyl-ACP reductase [Burkholderiales bacterium]|jgi:NAD(P)-dependent dehydrogenase (short-subunit alcohol dehydrogenase family)|nr:3-ketoacyl-ACP reductase [Burkholderiales bacterium]
MGSCRPVALITGARRGIGAAIALALARAGFDMAITDIAEDDDARATLAALRAAGAKAHFLQSDLADTSDHARVVAEAVAQCGAIDCLVNNAGVPSPARGDLLDVRPEAFDQVLGVNLRGTFFLTQAVARHMSASASRNARSIITVSSVSAELASPERGEYCMSKAGLAMLTKLFALRLARDGIPVFEVRPGVIRTSMTAAVADKYDRRIADGLVPMGRWGGAEDIGAAVAALASGQFQFATGSVINLDGGLAIPRL